MGRSLNPSQPNRAHSVNPFMKITSQIVACALMMFAICCAAPISAQSPDQEQNLFACTNGFDSCDSSALTQADKNAVAKAKREQNISNCENSWTSCNRSTLSAAELAEVDIAVHRNLVADRWSGIGSVRPYPS